MNALLNVKDMRTWFTVSRSWKPGVPDKVIKAIDGVSFSIASGEVLSIVGESGCGKSTVGRTLTQLEKSSGGSAEFLGEDILALSNAKFKPMRRHLQMIFQDPFASLNPRLTIEQSLMEPLTIHRLVNSKDEAREVISQMLIKVGLDPSVMQRYPYEFSGGQRQRLGIARVMMLAPKLIIADEAVSALDVSIQAQVLNLIKQLQRESGVAMLFISHDLGVVRHISDRVAVMYLGKIVEIGTKAEIFSNASHPYTQLLLKSIPHANPMAKKQRVVILGEPASAANPPNGCAFHPRCSYVTDVCHHNYPTLEPISDQHSVACHHKGSLQQRDTL